MKRELSGGITSRKRFAGKSDFSAKQVSTTLLLLLLCLLMPQGLKAQSVDGLTADQTFDFVALAQQSTTINWGDNYTGTGLYRTPKYWDNINGNSMAGRFASATETNEGWFLRNDANRTVGLWSRASNHNNQLALCGMWNGDRVRITLASNSTSIKFVEANSAKMNGSFVTEGQEATGTFVFAAVKDGDVILQGFDNYTVIQKVEFFNSGNGYWSDWTVSFNPSSVSLAGGQTYNTNNANVTPNWVTPVFTSSNDRVATVDEKGVVTAHRIGTATITAKMDVGPEGNQWSHHATAELTVNVTSNEPVDPKYSYDPAIETYDLTGKTWTISQGESAGYKFYNNGYDAYYLSNPNNYELNNRLVIQNNLSAVI